MKMKCHICNLDLEYEWHGYCEHGQVCLKHIGYGSSYCMQEDIEKMSKMVGGDKNE